MCEGRRFQADGAATEKELFDELDDNLLNNFLYMRRSTKMPDNTNLSASTFLGGLPRNRNLLEGISGISSGLTVEKNCGSSSSFLINNTENFTAAAPKNLYIMLIEISHDTATKTVRLRSKHSAIFTRKINQWQH